MIEILREGNERFVAGKRLERDLARQIQATADGQYPMAVVLHCIDSRSTAELLFDLGLGDIFSVRLAGNVVSSEVLGSMEFGCKISGAKLVVVMGHTRCGAVTAAAKYYGSRSSVGVVTSCEHLDPLVNHIQKSIDPDRFPGTHASEEQMQNFVDDLARRNVQRMIVEIREQSATLAALEKQGQIGIVGALYDVSTGRVEFL